MICDGIHVDPLLVRLFYRAKGPDHGILITDAIAATGMPDGVYRLGGMEVTVSNGRCTFEGRLAGSVLTLDQAVRNFVQFTDAPYSVGVRYASTNPALMMGIDDIYGELTRAGRQTSQYYRPGNVERCCSTEKYLTPRELITWVVPTLFGCRARHSAPCNGSIASEWIRA